MSNAKENRIRAEYLRVPWLDIQDVSFGGGPEEGEAW